jgi:ribonuclease HI
VALDQEKAYDRIHHKYLWKIMENFGLPKPFIQTIEGLYSQAKTSVFIDGTISQPYRVTHGVRQGDPLLCLLFIIAIEPLSRLVQDSDILGIPIPHTPKSLKITLYADDTTVYLQNCDSLEKLNTLLDQWCVISGAKFNKEKMEIIPIGRPEYRETVIAYRKLNNSDTPIPDDIRIAVDSVPTRILGTFVGNNIDNSAFWHKCVEKLARILDRWEASGIYPDWQTRRSIVNQSLIAATQFHTAAMSMPEPGLKALWKVCRSFVWASSQHPSIKATSLFCSEKEGGIGLINIKARNEAIIGMKLRTYLTASPRPIWTYFADALYAKTIPTKIAKHTEGVAIRPYVENWQPSTKSKHFKLPTFLKLMADFAKKYGLIFDHPRLSFEQISSQPVWLHYAELFSKLSSIKSNANEHLRETHAVWDVGDLWEFAQRQERMGDAHTPIPSCQCEECKNDRDLRGCSAPFKCIIQANRALKRLQDTKWYPPEHLHDPDGLSLTHHRLTANKLAHENRSAITIDPSMTSKDKAGDGFRLFTNGSRTQQKAVRHRRVAFDDEHRHVWTDGSRLNNGDYGATTGAGVFYGPNDPQNKALCLPESYSTNNAGELWAVLTMLLNTSTVSPLTIHTDSQMIVDGLTKFLQKWEDQGYIGVPNKELWKAIIARCRIRGAPTLIQKVHAHVGIHGNEEAERLANVGARSTEIDEKEIEVTNAFNVHGARLSSISQKVIYTHLV